MKPLFGNKIQVIGVMSGTSLDGLDLVAVEFQSVKEIWSFNIQFAETIKYSQDWLRKLKLAPSISGEKLTELNSEYGIFIGEKINEFIKKTSFSPELIASHGHTVFHQPEKHFTLQIGNGAEIASKTKIKTVADFRITDVALGGQGAPLVPVGDKLLFSEFESCLNLGGFANISFDEKGKRIAFDICPANFILNFYSEKQGLTFDKNGELGKKGNVDYSLLEKLNNLLFYKRKPPKSLGREWMENVFIPAINNSPISDVDKMRTVYEHIATQISSYLKQKGKTLITGGGAKNTFLIERLQAISDADIIIPEERIIDFKEALIFAFLGVLKVQNQINCFSSVTGARQDSSCGILFSFS